MCIVIELLLTHLNTILGPDLCVLNIAVIFFSLNYVMSVKEELWHTVVLIFGFVWWQLSDAAVS